MSAHTPPDGIRAPAIDLVRLAEATGERIAKDKEVREAEATAKWRDEESRRLALQHAAPELLAALDRIVAAHEAPLAPSMLPTQTHTYDSSFHGGECSKTGRYYGVCHCCAEDQRRDVENRQAVHDIDVRKAIDDARAAIAKARGK